MKDEKSEFGMGLTYCLGLFLAHAEKYSPEHGRHSAERWFRGASDHLYDLRIPDTLPSELRKRLTAFRTKCLNHGHWHSQIFDAMTFDKKEDEVRVVIEEAKDLLREIDSAFGIKTIKGEFE